MFGILCLIAIPVGYFLREELEVTATGRPVAFPTAVALLSDPCSMNVQLQPRTLPWQPWKHLRERFFGFDHRQRLEVDPAFRAQGDIYIILNRRTREAYQISRQQIQRTSDGQRSIAIRTRYVFFENPNWENDPWLLLWRGSC